MGPRTYAAHLISTPRLPFTAAYFGSLGLSLYFSLGVSDGPGLSCRKAISHSNLCFFTQLHSTILTLISAIIQLACLVWYLVSYFPMGSAGLRMATSFGAQRATAWMSG